MIIEYTRNPNATVDAKLQSLQESVQLALNEIANAMGMPEDSKKTGNSGSSKALEYYPVGAIYMSVDETDPSEIFGGSWEKISDRFLLASGTRDAEDEGGEAEVTLTGAQSGVPAHTHGMAHTHKHTHRLGPDGNRKVPALEDSNSWSAGKVASGSTTSKSYLNKEANDTLYYAVQTDADSTAASKSNTDNNTASGAAEAHNNMPPYMVVNMWKRVA